MSRKADTCCYNYMLLFPGMIIIYESLAADRKVQIKTQLKFTDEIKSKVGN